MSPRTRPGPLQELDLRLVAIPATSGVPNYPRKRPHSPSVGCFDSPAKRRLKTEGGIHTPKLKSPLSTSSNSARFAPAHFHALLQGSDSPAKRLDFGSSEASDTTVCEAFHRRVGGTGTPRRSPTRTPTARLRRSPRLSVQTRRSPHGDSGSDANGQTSVDAHAAVIRAHPTASLTIPRVVTPPDRQSIHYPGFDIYQDPHTVLPMAHSASASVDDASRSLALDQEQDKENTAPRRRKSSKKTVNSITLSEPALPKYLSPSPKKSFPASPHPKHVCDYLSIHTFATPKERILRPIASPAATLVGVTPGRTPLGKEERKQMRRAMEDEVDDVDGEDEMIL